MSHAEESTVSVNTDSSTPAGTCPKNPVELLAYRYNGQTVYVVPAETHEQAIDFALKVFPELAHIARDRIAICVNGHIGKDRGHIRIAPMAWDVVIRKLSSFEVLDIVVLPTPPKDSEAVEVHTAGIHHDAPPKYEEEKSRSGEESGPSHGRPHLRSSTSTSSMSVWAKGLFGKRSD